MRVGDRGAGLIGAIAGVTVFLAFLLFAVQLLTNLYATSVVTNAAYDGVRQVAGSNVDHADPAATAMAQAEAEAHIRDLLGSTGERAQFTWDADDSAISLRIVVQTPRILPPGLGSSLGFDEVDRTVRVRVEELR